MFMPGALRVRSRIKSLIRCQRGNTVIIVAAVMPMMIGAGAVGIDVAQWALVKRHLQRAADTGALAGANAVMQKHSAQPAVERSLVHNNQIAIASTVVENAPTAGGFIGNTAAVRVIVTARPQLPFVSFFLNNTTMTAEATAMAMPNPTYCLVTLEDGPQVGFDFSGSAGVVADCGLMTNSRRKPSAVTFGGSSASVRAPVVGAVGSLASAANWGTGTQLVPNLAKLPDPYAYAPEASTFITTPCNTAVNVEGNGNSQNTQAVSPGCYTSMRFASRASLSPGVYVVNGGTLEFTSNAVVAGTGVTFVLTGGSAASIANVIVSGGATLNLSAPTTGSLRDILIYQDRRAKHTGSTNNMTGNSASTLTGGIYLPGSNLNFTGNSSATGVCLRIVTLTMSFTGNSAANISCAGTPNPGLFGRSVRLVA